MKHFFHTFFYTPIYNLVVLCSSFVPGGDIGLSIILATIVVKVILLPLSLSAAHTQKKMKNIEGEIKRIKDNHKNDRERLARETLALYKEHNIRPFASIFSMFIQIPFILALYFVFSWQALTVIDTSLLYPFVHVESLHTSLLFLGLLDVSAKSLLLALLAGASQLAMGMYTIPLPKKVEGGTTSDDFARAMGLQMRIVLPLIIGFVGYTSGAIALYFITSALFALVQEYVVRKTHKVL